jgi:hypothetical protein
MYAHKQETAPNRTGAPFVIDGREVDLGVEKSFDSVMGT